MTKAISFLFFFYFIQCNGLTENIEDKKAHQEAITKELVHQGVDKIHCKIMMEEYQYCLELKQLQDMAYKLKPTN